MISLKRIFPAIVAACLAAYSAGGQEQRSAGGAPAPELDPLTITIEGSTNPDAGQQRGEGFTLLYQGPAGLEADPGRGSWGQVVVFKNSTAYKTYRILITHTRADADATQYSEVKLGSVTPASAATN